ncbi:MAG: multidrug effflux MFS transporter [Gaiella sp.]|uniref:multidrug effflux MFS transporter n=1 Tax=Gaiella sp. TaxID=2663207 RepID=UPI003C77DE0D
MLGSVSAIGPAAMDAYLPGLPELARDFGASPSAAQVTVTTYLLGLALGQLLSGPLSDVHGRRRPLVAGMAVFTVTTLACSLAPSLSVLAGMRLVQGTAAAVGVAVGRAIVRDLYAGAAGARYLSRLMIVIGLAPILAPIVGGQLLRVTSWRGVFVALSVLGLALTAVGARLLPETLPRERRRAGGLRVTLETFARLLGDRRFVGFVLIVGLGGGAMIGYVAGSSFVLQDVYGASPQLYGLLFGLNAVFLVAGAQVNAHLLATRSPRSLLRVGLLMLVVAGVALVVIVSLPTAGLAMVVAPLMLQMASWSFVQANALALALTDHPEVAGTAAALLGVSQYAFGAFAAPLVGLGGSDTALPMALVIAGCAVGAALAFEGLASRSRDGSAQIAEGTTIT